MLRQRTERFKSHLDNVPALSGVPALSRGVVWMIALVMILGGIYYVTRGQARATMEPLFGGHALRDLELAQAEMAFSSAGLKGWRRQDGHLLIPCDTRHEYLATLEQSSALPYALQSGAEQAFGGGSYFESESEKRLRHASAKAFGLGNKIATFDDIAWASVDYDEKVTNAFDQKPIQSASVVLIPSDGKPVSPIRIQMIQDLVCAAYAGMDADQVTVTDTSSRKLYNGTETLQTRQQRQAECELEQRLTDLLSGYKGLQIAAKSVRTDSGSKPDDESSPQREDVGGADHRERARQDFAMRVSVGIPESRFHAQWINDYRSQHPGSIIAEPPTVEQLASARTKVVANLRDAISPLIAAGATVDDQAIRIWSFPDSQESKIYLQASDRSAEFPVIFEFAKTHAAIIIPLAGLMLVGVAFWIAAVRMRVRTGSLDHTPAADVRSTGDSDRRSTGAAVSAATETTLRDDLADLVESNPELAAQIVHSWIADAA